GGAVSTLAGSPGSIGSTDGVGTAASFNYPTNVATDPAGNVYVADARNNTIRKISPTGSVSTLAGSAGASGSADGVGATASFNFPTGVGTDSSGNVYVADTYNSTVRKIAPQGAVSTLAGAAEVAGSANGVGAAASFLQPEGIATDSEGNVFVSDSWNNTIRKITPAGAGRTPPRAGAGEGSRGGQGGGGGIWGAGGVA